MQSPDLFPSFSSFTPDDSYGLVPLGSSQFLNDLQVKGKLGNELALLERLVRELSPSGDSSHQLREVTANIRSLGEQLVCRPSTCTSAEPIAVIGMGCRFPGESDNPDAFWRLISKGGDAVREIPSDRWDVNEHYDPDPFKPGKMYARHGGFVRNLDLFDAGFFGISPREAISLDPQQRLVLEVGWESLENAGIAPDSLAGSPTGVFLGISTYDYSQLSQNFAHPNQIDGYYGTGSAFSIASGRLSYLLGLRGPNLSIDTACSSSLVALHLAVQSLRARECGMALVGGVNALLSPNTTLFFSKLRAMSADGRCKTFDADADGYARAEGCGFVVLRPLSEALANQDHVLAVIRGTAVNHGGRSIGLTAPNEGGQADVIRQAMANAGVQPAEIDYVEAHGTGTPLGDPIEARALSMAIADDPQRRENLLVGSVKTNIGHMEAGAGMAGLIKVILSMQHDQLPPTLHFRRMNPQIADAQLPLTISTETVPWPRTDKKSRIAGVSSFGFGGTNAHAIVEEGPCVPPSQAGEDRSWHVLTISAKSPGALSEMVKRYQTYLEANPHQDIGNLCYTANTGRASLSHRLAVVAKDTAGLKTSLTNYQLGKPRHDVFTGHKDSNSHKLVFLFTGQGAQYIGMGQELYETQPVFRAILDRCDEMLRDDREHSLLDVMFGRTEVPLLDQTQYAQPALFALEYGLAQLWRSWGIEPDAVIGHSVGECIAACVSGLFSMEEALRLIARRSSLMQSLPQVGSMAAVIAPEEVISEAIAAYPDTVSIATMNAPRNVVLAGVTEHLRNVLKKLTERGYSAQMLAVSNAFHSPLMDPILDAFEPFAGELDYQDLRVPMVSNLTGEFIDAAEVKRPVYWRRHVRETVRFSQGIEFLHQRGYDQFLEIGPARNLLGVARQCVPEGYGQWWPSLRKGRTDWRSLCETLGGMFVSGVRVDWKGFDAQYSRRKLALPTYPFQRRRYWIPISGMRRPDLAADGDADRVDELIGKRLPSDDQHPCFEAEYTNQSPAIFSDHRVFGFVVVPAAGYIALAAAAAEQVYGHGTLIMEGVMVPAALVLQADERRMVRTTLAEETPADVKFQVKSQAVVERLNGAEILHASGRLRIDRGENELSTTDVESVESRMIDVYAGSAFYEAIARTQIVHGPAFQWFSTIRRGNGEALGTITAPTATSGCPKFRLHPGLVDACVQLLAATLSPLQLTADAYVPVAFERLELRGDPQTAHWCHARNSQTDHSSGSSISGDVDVLNRQGQVILSIRGIVMQRVTKKTLLDVLRRDLDQQLYSIEWQKVPLESVTVTVRNEAESSLPGEAKSPSALWLVFADEKGLAGRLSERLSHTGDTCIQIGRGEGFRRLAENRFELNPLQRSDYERLLDELFSSAYPACRGIVHMWSLDEPAMVEDENHNLFADRLFSLHSVLNLVQSLTARERLQPNNLWLITRGAQSVEWDAGNVALRQSPVWGMGRVIAMEHVSLNCTRVDLDPNETELDDELLHREIAAASREDQIAFRRKARYVARLIRHRSGDPKSRSGKLSVPSGEPYRLEIPQRGVLDQLSIVPISRCRPGADEIEIEVRASGLNFRDVMNALGLYPGDPGPLGGECSGVITAVGTDVKDLQPGDEVLGIAPASIASHATTRAALVARKPGNISFSEAATVAIPFLTAYYALRVLGKVSAGDRVLIHAAAGGVGLAAIQIAQRAGAEVFATCGSPEKRAYLASLGVKHLMNSRDTTFADELLASTNGRGVDLVLNSLAGEFIPRSLSVLAEGGRFLEIGKVGIWTHDQVAEFRRDIAYFPIALDQMAVDETELVGDMLREILTLMGNGELQPIRREEFAIEQSVEAFRHMAQAKHIGKVVITQPTRNTGIIETDGPLTFADDGSYLISGGFGALGMTVANWMIERGARHIVLVGRSNGPSIDEKIKSLKLAGAHVYHLHADVADGAALKLAWESLLARGLPSLRGVIHAAGVLDDGVLSQQDWSRFRAVMGPKVDGSWNLHLLTRDLPLDFFVLFSSVASLFGSPGQANYAAANAFLDGLAWHRQANGLPALSINWGPWAKLGFSAAAGEHAERHWAALGISTIPAARGLRLFEHLMRQSSPQLAAVGVDWAQWSSTVAAAYPRLPFFDVACMNAKESGLNRRREVGEKVRRELAEARPENRPQVLEAYLRDLVATTLSVSLNDVDPDQPLNELGFDSLMAVEMKNALEMDLGIQLNLAGFVQGISVRSLVMHVAEQIEKKAGASSSATTSASLTNSAAVPMPIHSSETAELVKGMSDAEVDAALSGLLATKG